MSWHLVDEWIDLAQARHVVIYKNRDTGAEHHLIHEFRVEACAHCGTPKAIKGQPVDFVQLKADTLQALNQHHRETLRYTEQHHGVRLGTERKK